MTRIMYDSVSPAGIPEGAELVGGYVNGRFKWTPADWARFPRAAHVGVNVNGDLADGGDILDVERFDAVPGQIPAWVRGRHAAGGMHGVYCSLATLPAVQAILRSIPIPTAIWVADWTDAAHQVTGCAATQYRNTPGYDESAVYDDGWHPTPKS